MSVIVYRDGVMAADTRAYSGDATPIGHKMKIFRLTDGSLVGIATNKPGLGEALVNWFNAGCTHEALPDGELVFSALLVRPTGDVFLYSDSPYPSGPLAGHYFAIGSGDRYALGAFAMDATAEQAVSAACMFDVWCSTPIAVLKLYEDDDEEPVGEGVDEGDEPADAEEDPQNGE